MLNQETNSNIKAPSEGELFVSEYLKYKGITFEREVKLYNLKEDKKSHRRVDFYMPKFKSYIEFNGRYNNSREDRDRYKEKKIVYSKNNIPCVYLYPENLGIIDFVFTKRLIEQLKKHKLKKELFIFQLHRFLDNRANSLVWFVFSVLILTLNYKQYDIGIIIFLYGVIIFQMYKLIIGINKFFIKNEIQFDN